MSKSYKRLINLEWIARLENMRWRDPEIAHHLNMTLAGLATAKQDPDFPRIRARILTGVLSDIDEKLANDNEYIRERIHGMMPTALEGLYQSALQTKNERVRLAACSEIMDRDGRLAKVTRVGLPTEDQGGIGAKIDDETADALITAVKLSRENAKHITPSIDSEPSSNKVQ